MFGVVRNKVEGAPLECLLISDYDQPPSAFVLSGPFTISGEAKILDVTVRPAGANFVEAIKDKFGTEIKTIGRRQMLDAYEAVPDSEAAAEAARWMVQAEEVVEPSKEEVFRSCKLALAFQELLDDEDATAITVACYGSMWRTLPAYPCLGFSRLNDMGLGGICESDLQSAMTHIRFQSLVGRPGFTSDPTIDASGNSIILAHCLGTMVDAPDLERGCRTKIAVELDGDIEKLWQNWSHGLHRVTCYGDLTQDQRRFRRFKGIEMVHEA